MLFIPNECRGAEGQRAKGKGQKQAKSKCKNKKLLKGTVRGKPLW